MRNEGHPSVSRQLTDPLCCKGRREGEIHVLNLKQTDCFLQIKSVICAITANGKLGSDNCTVRNTVYFNVFPLDMLLFAVKTFSCVFRNK